MVYVLVWVLLLYTLGETIVDEVFAFFGVVAVVDVVGVVIVVVVMVVDVVVVVMVVDVVVVVIEVVVVGIETVNFNLSLLPPKFASAIYIPPSSGLK